LLHSRSVNADRSAPAAVRDISEEGKIDNERCRPRLRGTERRPVDQASMDHMRVDYSLFKVSMSAATLARFFAAAK
jgi:hypothetical protein